MNLRERVERLERGLASIEYEDSTRRKRLQEQRLLWWQECRDDPMSPPINVPQWYTQWELLLEHLGLEFVHVEEHDEIAEVEKCAD